MKTDVIEVQSNGKGTEEALRQVEAAAVFKNLDQKSALHLRLLAEEMMGMLRAMVGDVKASFWMEDLDKAFELHLQTTTLMDPEKRKNLLSVSSSGKNAAAKGIMGKIRDIFEEAMASRNGEDAILYEDWRFSSGEAAGMPMMGDVSSWSLNQYRSRLEKNKTEEWDELEKSIVANLADEVEIYIKGSSVELVIYKKF